MNENRTVIFLGAGAAKADNAPLQNQLFKYFFERVHYEKNISNELMRVYNLLSDFFIKYFGTNVDSESTVFPTFEEVLGVLELEKLHKQETGNDEYINALVASMGLAIEYTLDLERKDSQRYHSILVNKLRESNALDSITFISSNYDLLLDNAILERGNIDYCHEFDSLPIGIKVLKLHGSLNWLKCKKCNKIKIVHATKIANDYYLKRYIGNCECGSGEYDTVIIPPTYFKEFDDVFGPIWSAAFHAIHEADHVIFCGYSFPDADIQIKTLFKTAEKERKQPLRVTVINKDEVPAEKERYSRFFKCEVNYLNVDFEQFARNPMKIIGSI